MWVRQTTGKAPSSVVDSSGSIIHQEYPIFGWQGSGLGNIEIDGRKDGWRDLGRERNGTERNVMEYYPVAAVHFGTHSLFFDCVHKMYSRTACVAAY